MHHLNFAFQVTRNMRYKFTEKVTSKLVTWVADLIVEDTFPLLKHVFVCAQAPQLCKCHRCIHLKTWGYNQELDCDYSIFVNLNRLVQALNQSPIIEPRARVKILKLMQKIDELSQNFFWNAFRIFSHNGVENLVVPFTQCIFFERLHLLALLLILLDLCLWHLQLVLLLSLRNIRLHICSRRCL